MIGPLTVPLWLMGRDTGRFHVGSCQTIPRFDVEKRSVPPKMSVPPFSVCETLPPEKPPRAGSADEVTTRTDAIASGGSPPPPPRTETPSSVVMFWFAAAPITENVESSSDAIPGIDKSRSISRAGSARRSESASAPAPTSPIAERSPIAGPAVITTRSSTCDAADRYTLVPSTGDRPTRDRRNDAVLKPNRLHGDEVFAFCLRKDQCVRTVRGRCAHSASCATPAR